MQKGKARESAAGPKPHLPGGQSLPSRGEPCPEHQHILHIISLAPRPKTGPRRSACSPGQQDSWVEVSVTQSKSWLPQAPRNPQPLPRGGAAPHLSPKPRAKAASSEGVAGTQAAGVCAGLRTAAARSGGRRGRAPNPGTQRPGEQGRPRRRARLTPPPVPSARLGGHWELGLSPSVSVLKSMESACSSAWRGRFQSARVRM